MNTQWIEVIANVLTALGILFHAAHYLYHRVTKSACSEHDAEGL
jgi:hypothetical protein